MKRIFGVLALVVLFAFVAQGETIFTRILNLRVAGKTILGGVAESGNGITKALGGSATIDFASASEGSELSSAITVTGAAAGDPCFVGVPTAAAALKADFSCFVTAANEVKVQFAPASKQRGAATLVSGTPSQVVVASITASSVCTAAPVGLTATIAGGGVAVSLTTTNLTITGPDSVTTVVNYECAAPVDPASGTYYVRVISAQ